VLTTTCIIHVELTSEADIGFCLLDCVLAHVEKSARAEDAFSVKSTLCNVNGSVQINSVHKVEHAISIDLQDSGNGGDDGQKDVSNSGTTKVRAPRTLTLSNDPDQVPLVRSSSPGAPSPTMTSPLNAPTAGEKRSTQEVDRLEAH
jgi:hypothetical protein